MIDYFQKHGEFKPLINRLPDQNLGIVVVIPSYNEPALEQSLQSINNCDLPNCAVEVIVVINYPIGSPQEIIDNALECIDKVNEIEKSSGNTQLQFHYILASDLSSKQAGVGLARKIGMDEAAWRLYSLNQPSGIIACYDADSNCKQNYLVELDNLWKRFPKTHACSIRYEHPTEGNDFEQRIYQGITLYELHLRYYNQASRFIKFPFAFHTVGSSMACCAESYTKFGGMNRHQAGEDFYFLQKIIPHGNFKELNTTCVYPSPRPSYRVPFGTGRAMSKYLEDPNEQILTYNLNSFLTLIPLFESVDFLNQIKNQEIADWTKNLLHPALQVYLTSQGFAEKIAEIKANTNNPESFRKRFFFWFDAFKLLKYLNFANQDYFNRMPVEGEAITLAKGIGLKLPQSASSFELLRSYRDFENVTIL
jgi:glycosyltransferase involved in cell wall biosynthesis